MVVLLLSLPMVLAGAGRAFAGVCEDNRDFCFAGCLGSSSCHSKCLTSYVSCQREIHPHGPYTPPGGDLTAAPTSRPARDGAFLRWLAANPPARQ
jgi:hypothetical protein